MKDPINFEIDDIVARCELHPTEYDVFVEGWEDVGVLRSFLDHRKRRWVAVYPVDVVNVPVSKVFEYKLPHPSERSEVMTLAFELEKLGVTPSRVSCVIDADATHILGESFACGILLLTDFASIEMYAFNPETLSRVITVAAPKCGVDCEKLLASMESCLRELFLANLANHDLAYGLHWPKKLDKFLSVTSGELRLDVESFRQNYIEMRMDKRKYDTLYKRMKSLADTAPSESRHCIRGHDFVAVLTWFLRTHLKRKHLNQDSVANLLFVGISNEYLDSQSLFASLLQRSERRKIPRAGGSTPGAPGSRS